MTLTVAGFGMLRDSVSLMAIGIRHETLSPGIPMRLLIRISLSLLMGFLCVYTAPMAQASTAKAFEGSIHKPQQKSSLEETLEQDCISMTGAQGLKKCKDLIVQDQNNSEAWNQLGRIFYDLENYQEAYLSFMLATQFRTDYAIAWANICAALSQLQYYKDALDACDKSLSVNFSSKGPVDEKVLALNNKTVALYFLGRYQEALKISDQAVALKPDDAQANVNRTVALHALAHKIAPQSDDFT
ncbi:MAG: tetratricopeptide repeat protein [Cyanobacteria bacterium P01_H01_bin.26]